MKIRKMPKSEFWRMALQILVPFTLVNVISMGVTTRTPTQWTVFGCLALGLILLLIAVYWFLTEPTTKRNQS